MARQHAALALAAALVVGVLASIFTEVQSMGVCYGVIGDNLPPPADVVKLYQSQGISGMRIYAPDPATMKALDGTAIELIMDVGGFAALASDPAAATAWVQEHVVPYPGVHIKYLAVGNEVEGADTLKIVPAMKNIKDALSAASRPEIKVSTAVKMSVLGSSSPPSTGAFADAYMTDVAGFLKANGAPLLVNVYPYFAKKGTPEIDLSYALFTSTTTVSDSSLAYQNLFDAMVDAVYAALEKAGAPDVTVVVSESGWPSAGGVEASVANARTYNQNLINHVGRSGTPKRPAPLETYIFAMFNENQKGGDETEKHFGLFNPDKSPVYPIIF